MDIAGPVSQIEAFVFLVTRAFGKRPEGLDTAGSASTSDISQWLSLQGGLNAATLAPTNEDRTGWQARLASQK
jgi:hypothetical protein